MKPSREDIIRSVNEQRKEFSDRMNEEAKGMVVYDLTTQEGRDRFLVDNSHILLPTELEPVLAKIHTVGELGNSSWYEVVYHNGTEWCCYAGSDTFKDGEHVLRWKYCKDIL
ncbi:hypothetical protein FDG95_gp158 [Pectobacterium phage vB_PcaM_CBB]|uniref:Uncharacterized protein n=1 Tax=Pectobacterium phage vB_PcaM_CBB TaxID=2772511 RepID=A0A1L2CUL4_9CAUD|nr:hypothetical protein FDG95_gp158 [Pectobacterium phage vB_PcaM_CBB]AMM43723.1 hypothetical protein CBB_158 [Pectobacterium phage vB_PcaM_CBB]